MINEKAVPFRELKSEALQGDLVVVGGGLAGVCSALTAARNGLRVILVQDRPVLGGNASSEVRLWALGATSHMGNNNRWAREGGIIDEIFVENLYRNPEGNPLMFDALLLDKVAGEPNIRLLLNTAVFQVVKSAPDTIASVRAFCSQSSMMYDISGPLFCDASGDGIVAFQAGAAFRIGAESREEFGEKFAPDAEYGELLGHTIFFYSKDTGKPVTFVPPAFALDDITKIPRFGHIAAVDQGCAFWWLEYGGRLDTVHETEKIKWELWKVVYGVWNHIKNSGNFPEAATLTLEWVGLIPGKRESRRFEGDVMMIQQDVIEQRAHDDAVAFGGWAIDLHPADGVYSKKPACTQMHSRGVYQIPYRALYSRNLSNLFLAGRIISVSHVAFGSTRVMATTGHTAQAVGMAAVMCREGGLRPRDLMDPARMRALQARLLAAGQHIPGVVVAEQGNLAASAAVSATSRLTLSRLASCGRTVSLESPRAMLVPVAAGAMPRVSLKLDVAADTDLEVQLRASERPGNFTPDVVLATRTVRLAAGVGREIIVDFETVLDEARYVFVCVMPAAGVAVHLSEQRVTGVLSLVHGANKKVAKKAVQEPEGDLGVDRFEFWIPERRPGGENLAISFDPPLDGFASANALAGPARPTTGANAWVAALEDAAPALTLEWDEPRTIGRVALSFDTDFDHAMESVQWGHPERVMPFCVRDYRVRDGEGNVLAEVRGNHQTRNVLRLERPVTTRRLTVECLAVNGPCPAAIFEIRCYEP